MRWTSELIDHIQHLFPTQRGNAVIDDLSFFQALPLKFDTSNRKVPWWYSKKLYEGRNVEERNFRQIKEFWRVFTRYDKLDKTYNAFIAFVNCVIFSRN